MKTRFVLTVLTTFFYLSFYAQTNVGGTFTSDTTWMISGSPYNLISNVGIPDGITLTIESGVVVNYNSDHQIIIHGNLIANGDNDMNIVFNGNVTGSAMMLFQNTNLDNSSLSYIVMNGPKSGIRLSTNSNDNNSGKLTINNLTMINSEIKTNGNDSFAELIIDNSSITNTNVYGKYPLSEIIKINNSNITGGEIVSYAYNYGIFLNNDTVNGTSFEIGCCDANVNIIGSTVNEAGFYQESVSQPGYHNYLNIDGSHIKNSLIDMPVSTVNINTSYFLYNTDYTQASCIISGNGSIDSSHFVGKGDLVALERGSIGFTNNNTHSYIFTYCTFQGFATNIKLYSSGSVFGSGPVSINWCDFLDNPSNYVILNNSHYDATATNNWWGTTEIIAIENSIYDYWDDMTYGQVFYTDFLSGPINPSLGFQPLYCNSGFEISIFPNPFSIQTNLKANNNFENANLTIYNTSGHAVKNINNISGSNLKIGRDNLPNGIFIICMTQDNKTIITEKLIITD